MKPQPLSGASVRRRLYSLLNCTSAPAFDRDGVLGQRDTLAAGSAEQRRFCRGRIRGPGLRHGGPV